MAALKTRVEALEAKAMVGDWRPYRVELMDYTDPRMKTPAPVAPFLGAITRVVLMPLTHTTGQGAANGNA